MIKLETCKSIYTMLNNLNISHVKFISSCLISCVHRYFAKFSKNAADLSIPTRVFEGYDAHFRWTSGRKSDEWRQNETHTLSKIETIASIGHIWPRLTGFTNGKTT